MLNYLCLSLDLLFYFCCDCQSPQLYVFDNSMRLISVKKPKSAAYRRVFAVFYKTALHFTPFDAKYAEKRRSFSSETIHSLVPPYVRPNAPYLLSPKG